jgi:hypothetical protein
VKAHHPYPGSVILQFHEFPGSRYGRLIILLEGAYQVIVAYILVFYGIIAPVSFPQGILQLFEYWIGQAVILVLKEVLSLLKTGLGIVKISGLLSK